MATDVRNIIANLSGDADFQAWIQGIQAQLGVAVAAGHLVKTADTGQINSATVTKPAAISQSAGYEIYRFNDANQASYPVYFKIEYGTSTIASNPSLWLTVGTGSTGTGGLTGQQGTRKQCPQTFSATAGTTLPSYFCSRPDGFVLVNNYNQGSNSSWMVLLVERTKDGSGAITTDGIITLIGVTGGLAHQPIPFVGPMPPQVANGSHPGPAGINNQGAFGANIAIVPLMASALGQLRFGLCAMVFKGSELVSQGAIAATNLGSNHTYMPLTSLFTANQAGLANSADCLALLWE